MTVKEYLSQVRTIDIEINTKLHELYELKQKSLCVRSGTISERVQCSNDNSANKIIDKIIDLESLINSEIDKLVDLKAKIHNQIMQLNDSRYRILLIEYYINGRTLEQTAEIMGKDNDYIRHLHGWALANFKKTYNF